MGQEAIQQRAAGMRNRGNCDTAGKKLLQEYAA
jgi:hypothetical protein